MAKTSTFRKITAFVVTLTALIMTIAVGRIQAQPTEEYTIPPLSYPRWQYYQQHPDEYQQLLQSLPRVSHQIVPGTQLAPGVQPVGGTWTSLNNPNGQNLSNPILLTDGTVIAHVTCT